MFYKRFSVNDVNVAKKMLSMLALLLLMFDVNQADSIQNYCVLWLL